MRLSGSRTSARHSRRAISPGTLALLLAATAWTGAAQSSAPNSSTLANPLVNDVWRLETSGEPGQAAERLRDATASPAAPPAALRALAEFLERQHDPSARQAYERLASALSRAGAPREQRAEVARRLAVLDLETGDRAAAGRALTDYVTEGGTGLALPLASKPAAPAYIEIPGPLRSFARMAALSPELAPDDVLPALARNVVITGYQAAHSNEALEQTEYLKLVIRYIAQSRELEKLAGASKIIKIDTCDSTATGDVLRVIGYRMRGGCGSDLVLETINASRAFLTTDSGFPLSDLETALRTNRPFTLDYHPARLPILFGTEYWQSAKDKTQGEFIDYFLSDPSLCRLYLGLSKLDPETADGLRKTIPAPRLKLYAHVLDFFGGMFEIRDGKAVVPGGARSDKAWNDLAGVDPARGPQFFERLMNRDDGWLASYYDALARIQGPARDYLTDPEHLKRFYTAIRGRVTSPGPARPVFRSNTDMMLLTTRLHIDPDGKPHLPGNLDIWKNLFANHPQGKYDPKLSKAAGGWKDSEDVLEALFGLSRKLVENEPLKIFMALSDIDRNRAKPLEPATMDRLAREYRNMSAQYPLFAESPTLSDQTIIAFMDTAHAIGGIRDQSLRADVAGTMQALVALWQIFVRQDSIKPEQADASLAAILMPFVKVQNEREVFDGGQSGVRTLLTATGSDLKASPQDRMIDLLAGTSAPDNSVAHDRVIEDMIRVFESQRLAPLNTLFDLADNLDSVSRGEKLNTALAGRLATRISEIQLPRSAMSGTEKSSLAFGYWTERHIDSQRKMNLRASIDKAAADPNKLKELRGQLAPFLRDTLVGFAYIHYAPPGAQVLHTNPLFVRSHDFIGQQNSNHTWKETTVFGTGWPANAGGRLVGSLASLPYALAEAEQNFLIPTQQQALIWGDLVPQIIQTAVIPRWWNVAPVQIHWVGLHMAYGESLLAESALDTARRAQVLDALGRYAPPARLKKVEQLLTSADVPAALENVLPSELYLVANGLAPSDRESPLAASIRRMSADSPELTSPHAISRAFGTPKPTLANTYQPELLNLRTFPTLMGYSSRILAESWESNLLYYAALADEIHARPAELNLLVPEWTQQTVEQIFATHLEDWPALLRSLRLVGDDVRQKAKKLQAQVLN